MTKGKPPVSTPHYIRPVTAGIADEVVGYAVYLRTSPNKLDEAVGYFPVEKGSRKRELRRAVALHLAMTLQDDLNKGIE